MTTWTAGRPDRRGKHLVTVPVGPRPLTARLTGGEVERVRPVLDEAVAAAQRREFSRPQFAAAVGAVLGHDPFRQRRRVPRPAWSEFAGSGCSALVGIMFATDGDELWRQLVGGALAAFSLGNLVRLVSAWRRSSE